MKDTVTILISTLLGYALWLLLAMVVLGGAVRADTPTQARPISTVSFTSEAPRAIGPKLGGVLLLFKRTGTGGTRQGLRVSSSHTLGVSTAPLELRTTPQDSISIGSRT